MRRTYVMPVLNAAIRYPEARRFSPRVESILLKLRETESEFIAIVLQEAREMTDRGYRNLARWWLEDTVERLAERWYGWDATNGRTERLRAERERQR